MEEVEFPKSALVADLAKNLYQVNEESRDVKKEKNNGER